MPLLLALTLATASWAAPQAPQARPAATPPQTVLANDNTRAAGAADGATHTLRLVAGVGKWQPSGTSAAPLDIAAFGEEGGTLSSPGPLLRVREGTPVAASVRNTLASELRVFGLCDRPGPCAPLAVPAGESREIRFTLSAPGTFYYWGSTSASAITARPRRDTQLNGAIVVDPATGASDDRVMVLSEYDDGPAVGPCQTDSKDAVFAINGASWPHTARLTYAAGDSVRWRVVNLTCAQHAMHLHGFHFTVLSSGDGVVDRPLTGDQQRTAVTEAIMPGRTFAMAWTPTRAGNWLFHCHMVPHMAAPPEAMHAAHAGPTPAGRTTATAAKPDAAMTPSTDAAGMAGLVVGITVTGAAAKIPGEPSAPAKRFSLILREEPRRYGAATGYRMDLEGTEAPRLDDGPVPGPVIVVRRGEPTEVTIINRMTEPTAIHWHGMELESYYDGVPGYGGAGKTIAPPIAPGQSFVAKFTPPRAGTFIYHTHWHDEKQLAGGLYGAMLVLEPGERYDPATDHIVVIGLNGAIVPGAREPFALNGRATPAPIVMRSGATHRLRLINITSINVGLTAFLVDPSGIREWTPVAKDGAALPASQRQPRPARQQVAVGETYDFEFTPAGPQNLWLEVRRINGEWVLQAPIVIR